MIDFKIKQLDNIKFSHDELVMYYEKIKKDYSHLKWTVNSEIDLKTHKAKNMYSWAIQTNLKDSSIPCPPYHIKNNQETLDSDSFDAETELNFGFGKKLLDTFADVRQTVIVAHPPDTFIDIHTDNDKFLKIHIPIYTNEKCYFLFTDEKINLKIGNAYLVNTTLPHGTINEGNTDRVHLIFKIPYSNLSDILDNEYVLDVSLFDFDVLELPNIHFQIEDLIEYYNDVTNNFSHLKWTLPPKDPTHNSNHYPKDYDSAVGIYNYAIQTNLKNTNIAAPSYNVKWIPKEEKVMYFTNHTSLLYGFAKKVLTTFDKVEELVITGHPPGTGLSPHIDNQINFRIHFPIITNDLSYFGFDDRKYLLEKGKAYLVNTSRTHWTHNHGDCDRVHLFFKVPVGHIKKILHQNYIL